jgi:hypothetical protein
MQVVQSSGSTSGFQKGIAVFARNALCFQLRNSLYTNRRDFILHDNGDRKAHVWDNALFRRLSTVKPWWFLWVELNLADMKVVRCERGAVTPRRSQLRAYLRER